jgi:hypothetical protein
MKADLLETTSVLFLNILDQAYKLDEDFYKYLVYPELAVYYKNSIEPVLKPGKKYYTAIGLETDECLTDLSGVKENVYDEFGNLVIAKYIMSNQKKWLTNRPKLPIAAMKVIQLGIESYIADTTNFNDVYLGYRLSEVLNEEGIKAYENNEFDRYISVFYNAIEEFIAADRYHIYFCELRSSDMMLRKTIDYRIYDWIRRMESGEWGE